MKKQPAINDLLSVMTKLRSPTGCPWDREQNHLTLRRHAIEEVYELIDAIEAGDDIELAEELGDLLLQVVFHCQLAHERGVFDFEKVTRRLVDKLIRRHPHVFGDVVATTKFGPTGKKSSTRKNTAPSTNANPPWTAFPNTCPPCCVRKNCSRKPAKANCSPPNRRANRSPPRARRRRSARNYSRSSPPPRRAVGARRSCSPAKPSARRNRCADGNVW